MTTRREFFRLSLGGMAATLFARATPAFALRTAEITVYKSPTCGCCAKWVEHLEKNGLTVAVKEMDDVTPIKDSLGVPADLRSCHTAVMGGYVIEGHVPADLVKKVRTQKPKVAGLAVPGMPNDAPGMDGKGDGYKVIAFEKSGKTSVYATR